MTTILLAEDEQTLASVVADELTKAGYTVHLACDGEAALRLFVQHAPELVILDWMMPRLGGLTVLRRLREQSDVPILILTARDEEIDRVVGLEVGADDYVTKPFSLRELVAAQQGMFFAAAAASLWVSAHLPHPGASLRRVAGFTLLHGLIYSSGMIALFATVNAWLQRASAGMGLAAGDAPLSGPE